jgi:hypothetical protein
MGELSQDDLKQLLVFYKQKSADLEFELLQMQLKLNKANTVTQDQLPMEHI